MTELDHRDDGTRSTGSGPPLLAPADPAQWRRYLMARRHRRLRDRGEWWSIYDLVDSIDNMSMPHGYRSPEMRRWNQEFMVALTNGLFGRGKRTRVLLLDPEQPVQRVTAERAQHVLETLGSSGFARLAVCAFIRIDDAHDWIATWLDPWFIEQWLLHPAIREALTATREVQPRSPIGRNLSTTSASAIESIAGSREGSNLAGVINWFRGRVDDALRHGHKLIREEESTVACDQFPTLTPRAFYLRVWSVVVPEEWRRGGAPARPHKPRPKRR